MADAFVETILNQWAMEDLIPIFKDEGIDEEAFKLLDNSTIEAIVKKTGTQLKFKNKFKQFHIENWVLHCTASAPTNTVSSISADFSPAESCVSLPYPIQPEDVLLNDPSQPQENVQSFFLMSSELRKAHQLPDTASNEKIMAVDLEPPDKRRRTSVFPSGSLESLLSASVEGRRILARKKEGFLDNNLRNKLSHMIVSHLVNINQSITSNTFVALGEEIVDLLKKENKHTYYISYQAKTKTSPKLAPKGKLYSSYVNIRSAIKTVSKHSVSSSTEVTPEVPKKLVDPRIIDNLAFLNHAVEPWDTVVDYWTHTFQLRQENESGISLTEYFDKFPALKQQQGFLLIELDFNQLYPNKEEEEAKKTRVKLPFEIEGERDIDPSLLSLLCLPYIFAPVTVAGRRKNNKSWRPSRVEIQESFLLNITNIGFLEEKIEERRQNLLKEKQTLQPFFVCVGPIHKIEAYYVIIDDTKYKVDTPLKALDVTYKTFHAFNAKYPTESTHVWTFIQQMAYDMSTSFDNICTATRSLMTDIKRLLDR